MSFDPDEGHEAKHTDDHDEVNVRLGPAKQSPVIPSHVDEHKTRHARNRARPIETRAVQLAMKLSLLGQLFGDDEECKGRKTKRSGPEAPECPWPPRCLRKEGAKECTNDKPPRSHGTEKSKGEILLHPRRICTAEKCECVRGKQSATNALHGATDVEEDLAAYIGTESSKAGPDAQEEVAEDEQPLVAQYVA